MKPTVYMEEMDAFTYREKLAKDAVVFIPVGALEQHGSHMAMCVDAALTKAMAGATAEALVADTDGAMEAVVAAPINYGYRSQQRSGGGFHLSGTTSLSGTTLIALAKDVVEKARENGIRDVKIQLLSYWDFVDDETIEALYPDGFTGWDLEHAGVMETSLMLLFHPDLVDLGKTDDPLYEGLPAELPNYDVLPIVPGYTPPSGCLSSPVESSREKGAILRNVAVKHMVEAVKHEFSGEGDYHEV